MKKHLFTLIITTLFILSFYQNSNAGKAAWYDSQLKAVAFDPYWNGWGGNIYIDFNDDHTYAGIIIQDTVYSDIGYATFFGLYYNDGNESCSGWAETLGDRTQTTDYNSYVTETYCGDSPDKLRYFTFLWNPVPWDPDTRETNEETTVYVQPVDSSLNPIPIENYFYYSTNNTKWKRVKIKGD